MLFLDVLPEIRDYCSELNQEVNNLPGNKKSMTAKALEFLSFCLMAIIIAGCLNWDRFERMSAGRKLSKSLSWMMKHSPRIPWNYLLIASTKLIISKFDCRKCHLVIDDFDRERSKNTKEIFGVHKARNKKGGGFISAQNVVMLCLVTASVTIPVFFWFYQPDPEQKKWRKEDQRLRKLRIKKKYRPKQPPYNPCFPSKKEIAAKLLRKFRYYFASTIEITSISGDNAYMSRVMASEVGRIFPKAQFISQLRRDQHVAQAGQKYKRLDLYFERKKPHEKRMTLRGHLEKVVYYQSARLWVKSHHRILNIVAIRYEGEDRYRFLCGTDLTWKAEDIIRAFAFRWLVEVVIEDLKQHDGWGTGASQYGLKGACRGLLLCLLLDHFLLQHPMQLRLHRTGKPLHTAGSFKTHLQFESLLQSMKSILASDDPKAKLKAIADDISKVVILRKSTKHMSGKELEDLGPSPSLQKKFGYKRTA